MVNKLLIATICNNLEGIKSILENDTVNINYHYGGPYNNKTILEISCCEFISTIEPSTIQILIEKGAHGSNALFYAARENNHEIVQELIKSENIVKNNLVLLLLIEYIYKNNEKEEKYLEIVKILLEKINVNLIDENGYTAIRLATNFRYKFLVELILDKSNSKKLPDPAIISENINLKILLKNIRQKDDIIFLKNYQKYCASFPENIIEDNYILLMFSAERDLVNIVKYFLYLNVEPNIKFSNIFSKYVKYLSPLKYACVRGFHRTVEILLPHCDYLTINRAVIELVKTKFKLKKETKVNHKFCLELLLDNCHSDVTFKDKYDNTICHYVAMSQNSEIILMVLGRGGSLTCKNVLGKMPIEYIDAKILEKHFDECIHFVKHFNFYDSRYLIEINFKSLLPIGDGVGNDELSGETQILQYISSENQLKHLLHHPVIEMFLFLKWQRVKKFIFLNLLLYIGFMILLLIYIYLQTVQDFEEISNCTQETVRVILALFWCILILRELSQIFVFRLKYLKEFENWIESCLFVSTGYFIFKDYLSINMKYQISALIIVTSSIELMLLSGRHFRNFFISSIVLQTVSTTLFKWLASYIILIASFSVSFYFIFYGQRFFKTIYLSLFKTFVMITGEFELENFDFTPEYFIGPLLFIIFIFLVNIVLLGVCTALAINDIQLIINNAETKFQIVQIQHIVYWETAHNHFGRWFQRILSIKLLQNEPIIRVTVENNNHKYFLKINQQKSIEIDPNIIKKIILKNKNSYKFDNKEYPILTEEFFFELRRTFYNKNRSNFQLDM